MQSIREALMYAITAFQKARIDSYILDAEVLLAHVLKKDRVYLLAHPEKKITLKQQKTFLALTKKRALHTPLAYLVGHKEFFKLNFVTTNSALIPRPETEELVELVLEYCKNHPEVKSIIDVGTGSGAIAVSLATNVSSAIKIHATDYSQKALELAKKNARNNKVNTKITFKKSNLLKGMKEQFDVIIANLPYLSQKEYLRGVKRYPELKREPKSALLAKENGLALIDALLKQSPAHLSTPGVIFLEIGYEQGKKVEKLAKKHLANTKVEVIKDLCGRDRFVIIKTAQLESGKE